MMRIRIVRLEKGQQCIAVAVLVCTAILTVPALSGTTAYTYDVHGRIKTVTIPNAGENSVITYAYDAADNKLSTVIQTNDTHAPAKPLGLAATVVSWQRIDLTWGHSPESDLSYYKVYRGASVVGNPTGEAFQDQPLSGNTPYTYRVSAVDQAGNESVQSDPVSKTTPPQPDTTPPTDPSSLTAAVVTDSWINLSWTGSTDTGGSGLAGYQIYRNNGLIGTSASASYSDTTVAHSTSYSYKVRAYDGANNPSGFSNTYPIATPDRTPPSVPTGLSTYVWTSTSVELDWADSTDTGGGSVQGYKIYRNGSYISYSGASTYVDNSVSGGQTYNYTVSAYDTGSPANESAQSASAQAVTPAGWTAIVADNGTVLPAETAWYRDDTTCDGSTGIWYCVTTYYKKYGNLAAVWNRLWDPFFGTPCPGSPWGDPNYRQGATCLVEANSAGYHQ